MYPSVSLCHYVCHFVHVFPLQAILLLFNCQIVGRQNLRYDGDYCECDPTQCPTSSPGTICSGECYYGYCV